MSSTLDTRRLAMHNKRKRTNVIALTLSLGAMAFGVFWLIWILFETIYLGIGGLTLATFTEMTPPPQGEGGGLANAIFGSFVMVGLATLVGTPVGILAGVYLAEYGQKNWLGAAVRFINDILLSAPSIVVGLFVYAVVVAKMKSFSGLAGSMALALLVIPVVIRAARGGLRPGHAEVEGHPVHHAEGRPRRCHHRHPAGPGPRVRRDGASAVHGPVQPVLDQRCQRADGQPARHHLQVRDEPLRELAEAGLGRRLPDHPGRAAAEHPRPRALQEQTLRTQPWTPRSKRPWGSAPSCRCAT
jgi:hypothetical protein